jgi:hypothetical protein
LVPALTWARENRPALQKKVLTLFTLLWNPWSPWSVRILHEKACFWFW